MSRDFDSSPSPSLRAVGQATFGRFCTYIVDWKSNVGLGLLRPLEGSPFLTCVARRNASETGAGVVSRDFDSSPSPSLRAVGEATFGRCCTYIVDWKSNVGLGLLRPLEGSPFLTCVARRNASETGAGVVSRDFDSSPSPSLRAVGEATFGRCCMYIVDWKSNVGLGLLRPLEGAR